jgi:hypothetical protein
VSIFRRQIRAEEIPPSAPNPRRFRDALSNPISEDGDVKDLDLDRDSYRPASTTPGLSIEQFISDKTLEQSRHNPRQSKEQLRHVLLSNLDLQSEDPEESTTITPNIDMAGNQAQQPGLGVSNEEIFNYFTLMFRAAMNQQATSNTRTVETVLREQATVTETSFRKSGSWRPNWPNPRSQEDGRLSTRGRDPSAP